MTEVTLYVIAGLLLWGNIQALLVNARAHDWSDTARRSVEAAAAVVDDLLPPAAGAPAQEPSLHDRIIEYIIRRDADANWRLGDPRDHINLVAGPDGHIIRAEVK